MKRLIALMLFFFLAGTISVFAGEVKTINKDELKAMLDSPDLVILDVRTGKDWSSSEFKIKGAVRVSGNDVASVSSKYAKDSTIVLYCA